MESKIVIQQELSPASLAAIRSLIKEVVTELQTANMGEKLLSPAEPASSLTQLYQ